MKLSFSEKFMKNYIYDNEKDYTNLEDLFNKYDYNNLLLLDKADNKEYNIIEDYLNLSYKITPLEKQKFYNDKILNLINSLKKSATNVDLPKLPFGKHLSDDEFIELFSKCISYANYKFSENKLKDIKNKLLKKHKIIEKLFGHRQILKDLLENCLLTIVVSCAGNKWDQDDNLKLLTKVKTCCNTPLIKLEFNYNNNNTVLDKKELTDIFCSKIYLQNYYISLDEYIPNFKNIIKEENDLKPYIIKHIEKYNIYFCRLPSNMMALTIHTGNVYLNSDYLEEYYDEDDESSLLIIKEKIILNLAHELMHGLCREICPEMKENFLIKSVKKTKEQNDLIEFRDKFRETNIHPFDANESGNFFDFNFFDGYYFNTLYEKEAKFFSEIKNKDDITEFKNQLKSIILNERAENVSSFSKSVNKFKQMEIERRKCIRPGCLTLDQIKAFNLLHASEKEKIGRPKSNKSNEE